MQAFAGRRIFFELSSLKACFSIDKFAEFQHISKFLSTAICIVVRCHHRNNNRFRNHFY